MRSYESSTLKNVVSGPFSVRFRERFETSGVTPTKAHVWRMSWCVHAWSLASRHGFVVWFEV